MKLRPAGLAALVVLLLAGRTGAHSQPYSWIDLVVGPDSLRGEVTAHVVDLAHEIALADPDELLDPFARRTHEAALRVADLAAAHHRPVSFHAASSVVCLAANAHVAAAAGNGESVEHHMIHQVLFEAADRLPFTIEDGNLVLSSAPGLGFAIDPGHAAFGG